MEEQGLRADEVDAVTGPAMGRPRSATFRTLDLVGIDVFAMVADNLQHAAPEQWERDAFRPAAHHRARSSSGAHWAKKTRQGFYKRMKVDGETQILVLDPETMEYVPRRRLDAPSLTAVRGMDDVRERIRQLVQADDKAGRFAWEVLKRTLVVHRPACAADMADDIVSIDNAMRWGFGWELGPFQVWDAIGLGRVRATNGGRRRDDSRVGGAAGRRATRPPFYAMDGAP